MSRISRAAVALGLPSVKQSRVTLAKIATFVLALMSLGLTPGIAGAATLTTASVALSDPRPSQTGVTYTFTGSSVTNTSINCVQVVWSTGSGTTQAPAGFSGASGSVTAASSTLVNSSATGWSLAKSDGTSSTGQNNIYKYTNSGGITPSTLSGATFVLGGITNSSATDTGYWFSISTYANTDCASSPVDSATVQFINTNGSTLSLSVDTALTFTINAVGASQSCDGTTTTQASTATTIPFGTVTASANGVVCKDLTAATNSTNGYTIYARYTGQPANALSQTIADWTGSNASPTAFSSAGTEAYGYTTDDSSLGTGTADRFTNPSQGWAAATTSNAEVAYEAAGVAVTHYHIAHQVGISASTPAGTYTTTIIYTCTPIY